MKAVIIAGVSAGILAGLALSAQADPLDDAIKARRGYYQVVKLNSGPLFGMLKGKVPYDAKKAQTSADNLVLLTKMTNGAMWPKGSGNDVKKGATRALPAIWSKYPDVVEKSKAWKKAVAELAAVAGNGLDVLKPKVAAMGATCSACHKAYRAKEF